MAAFSILALIFGAVSAILGELFVALAIAPLAALFVFERKEKRILSYIVSILLVAVNFLIAGPLSVIGVEIVIVALIIAVAYARGMSKAECVLALTVVVSIMITLSLVFAAINETKVYTIESVISFYQNGFEAMKQEFVTQISEVTSSMGDGTEMLIYTAEDAAALFDRFANMLISVLVIISFALTGVILKVFSALMLRVSDEPDHIVSWRFVTSNIFAYFYLALFALYMFVAADTSVLAISIVNLYNVFMYVYAYFGFGYALGLISRGRSRGFGTVMLLLGCVMFSAVAFQILSLLGVFHTVTYNKFSKIIPPDNNSNHKGE